VSSPERVLFAVGLAVGPVLFLLALITANSLLSPKRPSDVKSSNYECGIPQASSPWLPVNVRFADVALLFVLFDAETALLFAVAPAVRGSVAGLVEVAVFSAFLGFGLLYAWRKGALKWPS
jgi:NADH-quinone oxidoreductase subunit A